MKTSRDPMERVFLNNDDNLRFQDFLAHHYSPAETLRDDLVGLERPQGRAEKHTKGDGQARWTD